MNSINLTPEELNEIKDMLKKVDKKLDDMLAKLNRQIEK